MHNAHNQKFQMPNTTTEKERKIQNVENAYYRKSFIIFWNQKNTEYLE